MTENGLNAPIFSVSEVSGHLKRVVEDSFSFVRVRGEVSGFKRAGSGHLYFRLKDDGAVLDAVCWRGTAARLSVEPEDGLEIIATGRLTTYPGRSNYQIVVDAVEVAGEGALLKLLDERRKDLASQGLFDADRKRPLPVLPNVIGVVTSPTGAVIHDILHRLNDRFPRRVLVWPVAVQGPDAKDQIEAAIDGFNALKVGGVDEKIPRPDVLIIARGGGSLEDLWAFNEENVVRAAARSAIPLISAVGHETDTTLIDFAADVRAPTPSAAAEMAVPVRVELLAQVEDDGARLVRAVGRCVMEHGTRLGGLARGLPDLNGLVANQRQRLDDWTDRLAGSLQTGLHRRHRNLAEAALASPAPRLAFARTALSHRSDGLRHAGRRITTWKRRDLSQTARLLDGLSYERVLDRGFALVTDTRGKAVTAVADLSPGDDVSIRMKDGDVGARVTAAGGVGVRGHKVVKKKTGARTDRRQGELL